MFFEHNQKLFVLAVNVGGFQRNGQGPLCYKGGIFSSSLIDIDWIERTIGNKMCDYNGTVLFTKNVTQFI